MLHVENLSTAWPLSTTVDNGHYYDIKENIINALISFLKKKENEINIKKKSIINEIIRELKTEKNFELFN